MVNKLGTSIWQSNPLVFWTIHLRFSGPVEVQLGFYMTRMVMNPKDKARAAALRDVLAPSHFARTYKLHPFANICEYPWVNTVPIFCFRQCKRGFTSDNPGRTSVLHQKKVCVCWGTTTNKSGAQTPFSPTLYRRQGRTVQIQWKH